MSLESKLSSCASILAGVGVAYEVAEHLPLLYSQATTSMRVCSGLVIGLGARASAQSAIAIACDSYRASNKLDVAVAETSKHLQEYGRRVTTATKDILPAFAFGTAGCALGAHFTDVGVDIGWFDKGSAWQSIATYMSGNVAGYSAFGYRAARSAGKPVFSKYTLGRVQEFFLFDYVGDIATFSPIFFPTLNALLEKGVSTPVAAASASVIAAVPYITIGAAILYEDTAKVTRRINKTVVDFFKKSQ